MKKYTPALGMILALVGLLPSACAQPRQHDAEVTRVIVETRVITREVTREVAQEVTRAVTREITRETEKESGPVQIVLWTSEEEANGCLQFVQLLADDYSVSNPRVSFTIIDKDIESLGRDVLTPGPGGCKPDLLWTGNDHIDPLVGADLIIPVDDMFELDRYVDAALAGVRRSGRTWGVPISNGNHLMLFYNKDMIEEPPQTTAHLIEMGQELTTDDQYGLVYNQTHPLWLVPWLGGFGGQVFAEDGTTPSLDSPEMVRTLQFLSDIVHEAAIVPAETDYDGSYVSFSKGRAAMVIDGEWAVDDYRETFGDKLGVARIPRVSATGEWPHPYTRGTYLIFPASLGEDETKLKAAMGFARFVTGAGSQALLVAKLSRLPALKAALEDPLITKDPVLKGSADQMRVGTPMPTVSEMRCNWDAMEREMQAALADTKTPERAAADMQQAAEICVQTLEEQ